MFRILFRCGDSTAHRLFSSLAMGYLFTAVRRTQNLLEYVQRRVDLFAPPFTGEKSGAFVNQYLPRDHQTINHS
jgi:hypothetical protein